jgi:hypothetical protein
MTTREHLHAIVDDLPESLLTSAEEALASMENAKARAFWEAMENAPVDDELILTEEELAQLDAAEASLDAGHRVNDADVRKLLGL